MVQDGASRDTEAVSQQPGAASLRHTHRLLGLVVKASASRAEDLGFEFRSRRGFFSGPGHTSDLKKMALQCLPCQAPGVIEPALGPVGPVSVYCD